MKETLAPSEWTVMNALWESSPMTLSETIKQIGSRANWSYKTFSAYMGILEKKGFITSVKRGRDKFYSPAVSREECIERESKSLIGKIEKHSMGLMMISMVKSGNLDENEKEELFKILEAHLKEAEQ